jgi:predicted nucleotidyltransferase
MPTFAQQALIDRITNVLQNDQSIESAWLSGSLGRDASDAFSDVDIVVVSDQPGGELARSYQTDISHIAETVLARIVFGRVLVCITPDWERFDLFFVTPGDLKGHERSKVKPLFIRGEAQPEATGPAPEPRKFDLSITEFWRVLGLAPVADGREEWLLAVEGVGLLRRIVIDTMLELNGSTQADRGGHLKLNAFLTPEQRAALEALPPLAANRQSTIEANVALTRLYLPYAKALAARRSMQWPEALEQAARRRFSTHFNVDI